MYIVCGLGNPGARYERTRHNVGFEVVDELARRFHFPPFKREKKSELSRGVMGDAEVFLHKPTTYMNLSGEALGPVARYYKIAPDRVIVIHDELDFDPGVLRLKRGGGAGGHNGLKSIIQHFDPGFLRLRMGVGKPPPGRPGADWVLSRFMPDERVLIDEAVVDTCEAVVAILEDGADKAMNTINRK
ncbi:MAG: aminoacyl-tRNA hydrolase [Myxococcota bacterium]